MPRRPGDAVEVALEQHHVHDAQPAFANERRAEVDKAEAAKLAEHRALAFTRQHTKQAAPVARSGMRRLRELRPPADLASDPAIPSFLGPRCEVPG